MKILLANNELRGGGAEKVILTLINEFLVMKHEVHLIIFDNIIEVDIPNNLLLHIIDNKNKFIKIYKLKSLMKKLEQETRFDLVLSNLPETDYFMRKLNHQNIYFCIHTTLSKAYIENKGFIKRFKRKIRFNLLYKNQNIITVSNGVKDDFLKNMKIKPKSIQTIYNPINFEIINKLSSEGNVINEDNYIVHIGNYGKVKCHELLLKAYKNSNLDLKLVLIGKNVKENTINIVKELNIEDKVVFTGYLKNPYNILKNAKLLIMSSSYEGFSMVLVEALALKTIPISTDCTSGPNEILIDELKDNLVPINNIKELSSKILEVINNYKKFDNLNYEKFIQKFEARKIANKYINLVNLFKKNN